MTPKTLFLSLIIGSSFLIDVIFSLSRYPILTISVCGIVLVYELVSPYLYSAR